MSDHNEHVVEHLSDLRGAPDEPYVGVGPDAARARATARRRRQRNAVVAAVTVLVVAMAGVALGLERSSGDRLRPVGPAPSTSATSPSGTPSPSAGLPAPGVPTTPPARVDTDGPARALGPIDWRNSVMNLPKNDMCPHTRVQFRDGKASFPPWQYSIDRYGDPAYGDITGDGLDDAVVVFDCFGDADTGGPESRIVVAAFTGNAKGGPVPLGVLHAEQGYVDPLPSISDDGTVVVDLRPASGSTHVESYRWNGSRFTLVGSRTAPPAR